VTDGVTTTYLYGADLLAQYDAAGNPTYLLTDGQGNVRLLVDAVGNVVGRYDYDAFGAVRSASGSASTTYRNAGHAADDAVGLIYMRARWYDPTLGRFLTLDPRLPGIWNSQDWNRYVYVRNNPVGLTDPEGQGIFDTVAGWAKTAYDLFNGAKKLFDFGRYMDENFVAPGKKYYNFLVSGDFTEQQEQEWRAAEQQYIQGWKGLPQKTWEAATAFPGTTVSGIVMRPGVPGTWQEAVGDLLLGKALDRLYSLPSRQATDRTMRQQYGVGPVESASPGARTPYYYIPSSVPGVYFRSGTVARPGGGK
jgi:RHS repeat-associated protein